VDDTGWVRHGFLLALFESAIIAAMPESAIGHPGGACHACYAEADAAMAANSWLP
jgi:hypothetical protein